MPKYYRESLCNDKHFLSKIMVDEIFWLVVDTVDSISLVAPLTNQTKQSEQCYVLMIETTYGGPSFKGRLLPVYSLTTEFLFEQIERLIHIMQAAGGFIFFLIMCDD